MLKSILNLMDCDHVGNHQFAGWHFLWCSLSLDVDKHMVVAKIILKANTHFDKKIVAFLLSFYLCVHR